MKIRICVCILVCLLIFPLVLSACQQEELGGSGEISDKSEYVGEKLNWDNSMFSSFQPPAKLKAENVTVKVIEETGINVLENDLRYLQINYGYRVGYDVYYVPCEELELYSIVNKNGDSGYYAAGDSHVVIIGNCLLIALAVHDASDYKEIVVKDTLNSKVVEVCEYFTHYDAAKYNVGANYGYCKQNSRTINSDGVCWFETYDAFPEWYFVTINVNDIPKDYELEVVKSGRIDGQGETSDVFKLTYDDLSDIYAHKGIFEQED